ncbi:hypothetical protein ACIRD3_11605 [Kitasatospora sp. NPDC093550]|uniref:hypothetical protein n=1 Tax=Kitasatospora sp. NPDC093550 TaxID=3364089 RepID=UPI0037FED34F
MRGTRGMRGRAGSRRTGSRRAGSRRVRAGVLVAAAALAGGGQFGSGAWPAAAAGTAPVRVCPAETLPPGLPSPAAAPASAPVPDGVVLPPSAALFAARYPGDVQYLVAPGDWTCDVVFFAGDGGEQAFVHPGPPVADPAGARFASVVQAVFVSGGAQTNIDLACPFIPQATASGGICNSPPHQGADRLHPLPVRTPGVFLTAVGVPAGTREPDLPATGGPDRTVALVTFQTPGGPGQEIGCTVPASASPVPTCQAALGHFLATSAAGRQLPPADLAAALADLDAFVAAYLA